MNKKVASIHKGHAPHWVGDGLPVRNVFSYTDLGRKELSPFLMLDYGSPAQFPPTSQVLGVGMHPHRGFETVTFVFQGGLQHSDTAGNHGEIGPGDVQWMTAGSGVLHEELHSAAFRKNGGTLQMAQLWVNLPASLKMTAPKYQTLLSQDIPVVHPQPDATLRVVAGSFGDVKGPASTFTPLNLWDVSLSKGKLELEVPEGYTTALFVAEGRATINGEQSVGEVNLVVLQREGSRFTIESSEPARILVLNGQPIDEPVVGYGPFVMNTQDEIVQAFSDYSSGRFASVK
jgi:redox-sensitive bicupin YhaK (pirin superfamily)